ncbi:MAG: XdhC family protein [Flavobacteriaceae bacterium]|nr:XdhC family protein [Flavobacteriaceae bacterium]
MNFWKSLHTALKNQEKLILLIVVESLKSSPGRQGFKMFVAPDNTFQGTIGGGVMEFGFVEEAKKELQENTDSKIRLKRQIHRGTKPESSGMICSGEQSIAFIPLSTAHLSIIDCLINNPKGVLNISASDLSYQKNIDMGSKFNFQKKSEKQWAYKEQIHQKPKLYIIGAGHVGAATSKLCQQVGFDVVLFDNRPNLNTFESNTEIANKHIIDYNCIADYIEEGLHVYIVVMTHGYKDDKIILAALVNKQFKFLGAMGSSVKIKIMFKTLIKEGFLQTDLDKIHAPLGLFIKSETPQEIAVSVAAQLIKAKNN